MKKITALFTALALVLGLCACTKKTADPIWQEQYDLGIRYLSEGNYQEAILAFTAAIEIDPKQAPAYVGRGDAYVLSGETEENLAAATADYETAIELDETNAGAYLGLANVYLLQGDADKVLEILRDGLGNTSNDLIEEKLNEILSKINSPDKENTVTPDLYPVDYTKLVVNDLMDIWGTDLQYEDYCLMGAARPVYYADLRIPMMFYYLDSNFPNEATGDEKIIIVGCYPQVPGTFTEVAPGISLQLNAAQLTELDYPITDSSESWYIQFGASYALDIEYSSTITISFIWFDSADPSSDPAQSVLIW